MTVKDGIWVHARTQQTVATVLQYDGAPIAQVRTDISLYADTEVQCCGEVTQLWRILSGKRLAHNHHSVWRGVMLVGGIRELIGKQWPTPTPEDTLWFMVTEVGEVIDAVLRKKPEYMRNRPTKSSILQECGDVAMMALTAWQQHRCSTDWQTLDKLFISVAQPMRWLLRAAVASVDDSVHVCDALANVMRAVNLIAPRSYWLSELASTLLRNTEKYDGNHLHEAEQLAYTLTSRV